MSTTRRRPRLDVAMLVLAALLLGFIAPLTGSPAQAQTPTGTNVVISQLYGAGGNSGAVLSHDYVELFNRGDQAADVSGWTLRYAATSGSSWTNRVILPDGASIPPGGYYLVQLAAGTAAGDFEPLPTPDATGGINMAGSNGKIALFTTQDDIPSTICPFDFDSLVDFVGYGTANCYEGDAAAPGISTTTAAFRVGDGCIDTDDNAADFTTAAPAPRNSASPLNPCSDDTSPNAPVVATCEELTVAAGEESSVQLAATDADGTVVDAAITHTTTDAVQLENLTPATEEGGTLTVDLAVDATLRFGTHPVEVTFTNDDEPTAQTDSCQITITVTGEVCDLADVHLTPIYAIQGDGASTPIPGQLVATRGVVTADFTSGGDSGIPADEGMRGFTIESVSADRDDDPSTSEGVFVFDGAGSFDGAIGDLVHVVGTTDEFFNVTQVAATEILDCGDATVDTTLPPPAELPMPTAPGDRDSQFEPLESMRVTYPGTFTVTDFWQLERFGEVFLSSDGVRPNPTNLVDPHDDAAYEDLLAANAANTILLDDGRTGQNLYPVAYVEPGDTMRIGDQLHELTAIMHFGFGAWRLQPIDRGAIAEEFQDNRTRPRPETPPGFDGSLTVASFNVLNYFNGDGYFVGDDHETAEGFPTARGAVTPSEFDRQTAKIVDAIVQMDADIVGLIEIENDEGPRQAAAALVDAINTTTGTELYDYLDTGTIGTDAIKMAYIYKPTTVELTGDYAILDSSVDPRFDDQRSRPVLTQTFTEILTGEAITVSVNHLKSKGSACAPADNDPRQGNCNGVRLRAAEAMADWLATDPTGEEAAGHLIIGDLNAYAKEDPIVALQEAGYTDLLDLFAADGVMPYTYTFSATQGYLDHALAEEDLLEFVTGAAAWNINADEVPVIDYLESCCDAPFNRRFRDPQVAEEYFQPHAYRSSDHDPVLVGFGLPPGTRDVCMAGGWRLQNLTFRNQGQCVAYVATRQGDGR